MSQELRYAHGAEDCREGLAQEGDMLRIWVNESDFWMLRMVGVDLAEVFTNGAVQSCLGRTK